jgi:DNA-binding GntR family transcriptional regulator
MLGNKRLMALYEEINLPLWLTRAQKDAGTPRDARMSLREHRAILRAFESRDPDAAAAAMAEHIEGSVDKLGVKLGLTNTVVGRDGRSTQT